MELTHYLKRFFHTHIFRNTSSISKCLTHNKSMLYPFLKMAFATEKEKDYYSKV